MSRLPHTPTNKSRPVIPPTQESEAREWVAMIIKAVEEDLARQAVKCANQCCGKVQPNQFESLGWKRRTMKSGKRWLCEACSRAFDAKQYCEFCTQIYLKSNLESSGLDGKEWAQCEGPNTCGRWAHVDCIGKKHKMTRKQVVADTFKHICSGCRAKKAKRVKPEDRIREGQLSE
eukprot:TRINITY_DN3578_c0_g1_i2.p2 TRINITY_DN3578_c0_g1~~TRINITY_DN3578_c0_g1_i2.p2  ORF type:complete len:175 (+),score=34.30 TRINITY_DN3578_c0_g1_i2:541-1065(+)